MTGKSLELMNLVESKEELASEISKMYDMYKSYKSSAESRWKEVTQYVYATSTRETENSNVGGKNEDGWNHSTHVPKLTQIYDNIYSNLMSTLFPNRNWMAIDGEDEDSTSMQSQQKVRGYLSTKHRLSKFRNEMAKCVSDFLIYGNCFANVYYSRETHTHPVSGREVLTYAGPRVERISPYDIVFNSLASSFKSSPKVIRTLKTMGELERDLIERPGQGYTAAALKKAKDLRLAAGSGINAREVNKYVQMSYDGYGSANQYLQSGYVEILEFYGDIYNQATDTFMKNHVITVIDRMWVLRSEPLKNMTGRPSIFHASYRGRPDNLWGMGPLDNLVGMQYQINHLENARADAFDRILYAQKLYVGDIIGPEDPHQMGAVFYAPTGEGSVQNLAPDTNALNADFQIADKERKMEEFAGSPKDAMGIRSPGEKTAYEVQQLSNAASRKFQDTAATFEETFVEEVLNAEIEEAKINMTEREDVRFDDAESGAQIMLGVTQDDLDINGRIVPVGARHFIEQNQQRALLSALDQAIASDPSMGNHISSLEKAHIWKKLLKEDGERLVTPFIRVSEEMELMQRQQIVQQQLQENLVTPAPGEEDEGFDEV